MFREYRASVDQDTERWRFLPSVEEDADDRPPEHLSPWGAVWYQCQRLRSLEVRGHTHMKVYGRLQHSLINLLRIDVKETQPHDRWTVTMQETLAAQVKRAEELERDRLRKRAEIRQQERDRQRELDILESRERHMDAQIHVWQRELQLNKERERIQRMERNRKLKALWPKVRAWCWTMIKVCSQWCWDALKLCSQWCWKMLKKSCSWCWEMIKVCACWSWEMVKIFAHWTWEKIKVCALWS